MSQMILYSILFLFFSYLWVIAFASEILNIYQVMDYMTGKKWSLNGLRQPPCVHICVTLRHTQPGVETKFIAALKSAVEHVRANPDADGGMAPVCEMAASIPFRGAVHEMLDRSMDLLYSV